MTDDPTTARAQREAAVASGATDDAVDRLSGTSRGGGRAPRSTPRSRQIAAQRQIAGDIDIDDAGVATRDTLGGTETFLRSEGTQQFAENVRDQFASAADFVTESDVAANVDARDIRAAPVVAEGRRDDVAERAREQSAADSEYIKARDLDADVSARGVTDLGVAPGRRDDVEQRTEQALASEDPFAQPSDFDADVTARGIESAGLTDTGARRRASRQFESETPLNEVDPSADLTQSGDALTLDRGAQRRAAAREFESDISLFGSGELDPQSDVRATDSGFALGREPARELAAEQIDAQTDADVTPGDIDLNQTDSGQFEAVFGGET